MEAGTGRATGRSIARRRSRLADVQPRPRRDAVLPPYANHPAQRRLADARLVVWLGRDQTAGTLSGGSETDGKGNTGRLNLGGPIATATGLVFIAATNDKRFRAFDSKTGGELWAAKLDMSAHAVPITYQGKDGKQYVAIVAAGASALDDPAPPGAEALVVFAR